METLLKKLRSSYPDIIFVSGDHFKWSAQDHSITYCPDADSAAIWSLLHELGHAVSEHHDFNTDIELLQKEMEAWDEAYQLAAQYSISISSEYADDCLDSYRDWIHKRSTCPTCTAQGIQSSTNAYVCLNCNSTWRVTNERLCRAYRRSEGNIK